MMAAKHRTPAEPHGPRPSAHRSAPADPLTAAVHSWLDRLKEEAEAWGEARHAQSLAGEMAHNLDPSSPEVGLLTQFRNSLSHVGRLGTHGQRAQMQRSFNNLRFVAKEKLGTIDRVALDACEPRLKREHQTLNDQLALMVLSQNDAKIRAERARDLHRDVHMMLNMDNNEPGFFMQMGMQFLDWSRDRWHRMSSNLKDFMADMDGLRQGHGSARDATGADNLHMWKQVLKIQEIQARMPENPTPAEIKDLAAELQQPLAQLEADLGDLSQERGRKVAMQASLVEGVRADAREQMLTRRPELRALVSTMVMARDGVGIQSLDAAPLVASAEVPAPEAFNGPDPMDAVAQLAPSPEQMQVDPAPEPGHRPTPTPSQGVSLERRPQDRALQPPTPTFRL